MHVIQQKLLRLVETYNLGNMALRDIGKIINEDHPQLIKHHLEQLEKKGLITWDKEQKTILRSGNNPGISTNIDFVVIPVLGAANCGEAQVYANQNIEGHIKVSRTLLKGRTWSFAIRAIGSSMNKANIESKSIEDGDYVIVDPRDRDIRSNDYVLSIIDDMANIKKILIDYDHNQIVLRSESTDHFPPIFLDASEGLQYFVNGKVIQVIKQSKF